MQRETIRSILRGMPRLAARGRASLNKDAPAHAIAWKETLAGAAMLRIDVEPFEVQGTEMFDEAFAKMAKARMEALVLFEDALFATERVRLATLAAKTRLPTVFGQRNSVDVGGETARGASSLQATTHAPSPQAA